MEGLFVYASAMPNIWKKIRLEILGPFCKTASGNRFLVFAVDPFTYWSEARALPSNDPDLISAFVFCLFSRFGGSELSVVGQKLEFCKNLESSLQKLYNIQNKLYGTEAVKDSAIFLERDRHGATQIYKFPDFGPDSGITIGWDNSAYLQNICVGEDVTLTPTEAALFSQSDPVNPIPKHPAFAKITKILRQRRVNHTNLGSDLLGFVSSNRLDWDSKLDGFLHHLRTAVAVCNDGYSAHHLMYGRNPCPMTGKELMMRSPRSLRGIRAILAFFGPVASVNPPCMPSKHKKSNTSSEPEAAANDLHGTTEENHPETRYNLRGTAKAASEKDSQQSKRTLEPVAADSQPDRTDQASVPEIAHKPLLSPSDQPSSSAVEVELIDSPLSILEDLTTQRKSLKQKAAEENPIMLKKKCKKGIGVRASRKKPNSTGGSRPRKRGNILKVRCPECPNTYVTCQEELDLHLRCHGIDEVSGDRIFTCTECGKVCKIWLNMVRHMSHHRDISSFRKLPDECYKCKICAKVFKVPECLREHVSVVHNNKKRFECHICHEKFKVYKTKMRHMDLKHANITYSCELCSYTTKVRRNLRLHVESHERKNRTVTVGTVAVPNEQATKVQPTGSVGYSRNEINPDSEAVGIPGSSSQLALFHRLQASATTETNRITLPLYSNNVSELTVDIASGSQIFYISPSSSSLPLTNMHLPHSVYTLHLPASGSAGSSACETLPCTFPDGIKNPIRDLNVTFVEPDFCS